MKALEKPYDLSPGCYVVARLDGRGFTKLLHETFGFACAFEPAFHVRMVHTAGHLMKWCGFSPLYGYTQSDEISLLFRPDDNTFGRKGTKWLSVLAGEASGRLSVYLGGAVAFDCRLTELASDVDVVTYFRWRQADAERNALNSLCYWGLVGEGKSRQEAHRLLKGLNADAKRSLKESRGFAVAGPADAFEGGVGLYFREYEKKYVDRLSGDDGVALRRELVSDHHLPRGSEYGRYIQNLLGSGRREEP